jgi:folate-binding protein YgfZ
LRVTRVADDALLLDVEAGFGEAVLARLKRFKLRTKADLALERWSGLAVRGPGVGDLAVPAGALAVPAGWPEVDGVDLLSDDELALTGAPLVDAGALEALRIESGVPAMGAELSDTTIPAEAGQWLIDASVSFAKGCYTGQELVARIDSRGGRVPRPIQGLRVDGDPPPVGTTVHHDGTEVGRVTSSARSARLGAIALAPLARSVDPGTPVELHHPDGTTGTAVSAALPMR